MNFSLLIQKIGHSTETSLQNAGSKRNETKLFYVEILEYIGIKKAKNNERFTELFLLDYLI